MARAHSASQQSMHSTRRCDRTRQLAGCRTTPGVSPAVTNPTKPLVRRRGARARLLWPLLKTFGTTNGGTFPPIHPPSPSHPLQHLMLTTSPSPGPFSCSLCLPTRGVGGGRSVIDTPLNCRRRWFIDGLVTVVFAEQTTRVS